MPKITTKQEKDKTTIVVGRRLRKTELEWVINFLSVKEKPRKTITRKQIQQLADEVTRGTWEKLKKKRGFTWS